MFLDRGGRRRRLFTALGVAFGLLFTAGAALLIAGLLGSSPVPIPGLPGNGQGILEPGGFGGAGVAPAPPMPDTRTHTPRTERPVTDGPTTRVPVPATATTTEKPGNRPTAKPGNPRPSRTR
ncbi:hypothetical protein [Dactylosporangium sp. CA-233914]|uniref:hypothetical protein n=1 Tax=Dactylosporangium sp. CA-233914 TaxID=3239934 RepID=UPI003D8B6FC4